MSSEEPLDLWEDEGGAIAPEPTDYKVAVRKGRLDRLSGWSQDGPMATESITIAGTRYEVERTSSKSGRPRIKLLGSRGAVYCAVRSVARPDRLFLVRPASSPHGYLDNPLGPVWLVEVDGRLRVAR